jgi:hypothetical protein
LSGEEGQHRLVEGARPLVHGHVTVVMLSASPLAPDNAQHPNPAQLDLAVAQLSDDIGNTVTWKGKSPP